jgi:hypothetical protein
MMDRKSVKTDTGGPDDHARRQMEQDLQRSVDAAVPDHEKLQEGFAENPLSQQVEDATKRHQPKPGTSPLRGGDGS